MATQLNYQAMSAQTVTDMSTDGIHKFCLLNSSGWVKPVDTATGNPLGIVENNPLSGAPAAVSYIGVTKLKVGAAIGIGTFLKAEYDATTAMNCGRGVDSTGAVLYTRAVALSASTAANQIITVRLVDMAPAVGATGLQGTTGSQGATGVQGVTGLVGATGAA